MDFVYVGKIVNTHGIKGELKVKSDFERKDLVFKKNFLLYIEDTPYEIESYRVHKEFDLITLKNYNDINLVLPLKNKDVYVKRSDISLKEGEYLYLDLIGSSVIIEGANYGKIVDYTLGINPLLKVDYNTKVYYIPLKADFIENVDILKKEITLKEYAKGLII